jgi:hypothetical protein
MSLKQCFDDTSPHQAFGVPYDLLLQNRTGAQSGDWAVHQSLRIRPVALMLNPQA